MNLHNLLKRKVSEFILKKYDLNFNELEVQMTKKYFIGDITIVVFPLVKTLRKSPLEIGNEIGEFLLKELEYVEEFNLIQGFLNLVIKSQFYLEFLNQIFDQDNYWFIKPSLEDPTILVEFASPNTNKPLHLGHIRNILLGDSISKILQANGKNIHKTQIINDRGIHICKSIVAWLKFGKNSTQRSS